MSLGQPPADIAAVEAVALSGRRDIRTLYVVTRREEERDGQPGKVRKAEATFWMDSDRLRVDHVDHDPDLGVAAGRRHVEGINCELAGYVLQYQDIPRVAARLEPKGKGSMFPAEPTFDPRLLGFLPDPFVLLRHGRLDGVVAATDRTQLRGAQEKLDGTDCWVARFEKKGGAIRGAIWYDPQKGYQPIRFEFESPTRDQIVRSVQAVTLQRVGDVWYPKTLRFTRHLGQRLVQQETVEVTQVRINEPIQPEVFTLRGIGIPEGTVFGIPSRRPESWAWTGSRLVPNSDYLKGLREQGTIPPEPDTEPVPVIPPADGRRYWLYGVAAALAVAAGLFLWRAVRRRA